MTDIQRDLTSPDYLSSIGVAAEDIPHVIATENEARQRAVETQRQEDVQLVAAAQQAVESGEMTEAEAAEALRAAGRHEALDAFVSLWQQEEQEYAAQEETEALPFFSASDYAARLAAQKWQERTAAEAEAETLRQQLAQKQVEELRADLKSFTESVPGAHKIAPQLEQQLVQKLQASGVLPSTPEERRAAIEEAVRETTVLGDATESVKQQVDAEWRALRRQNGSRDGLMTAADIARAEAAYKQARFDQLADSKMIDTQALKAGPTAEEQSAALTERYRSRQEKSTSFHTQVGDIAKRAAEANGDRDRGAGITAERQRYKEALARAEAEASYGTVTTTLSADAAQEPVKAGGYGPDGTWPDELGPAL